MSINKYQKLFEEAGYKEVPFPIRFEIYSFLIDHEHDDYPLEPLLNLYYNYKDDDRHDMEESEYEHGRIFRCIW